MDIYCDGSCLGNPGPGGWAALCVQGDRVIHKICGFQAYTTNNRMELFAAINGIKKFIKLDHNKQVYLYSDSVYLIQGITKWMTYWKQSSWKKGSIKNTDLWKQLDSLNLLSNVQWRWVKGHQGNVYNEIVDKIARSTARQMQSKGQDCSL